MFHRKFIRACLACSALPIFLGSAIAAAPSNPNPTTDLSGLTQNWDKNLPSGSRFTVLAEFNNEAVRDDNTGLVWEKSPSTTGVSNWFHATMACVNKTIGNTRGWRLPSVIELRSVQDPLLGTPFVPTGIFPNVQAAPLNQYWSASTFAVGATDGNQLFTAWHVSFYDGFAATAVKSTANFFVWCVRGPMQESLY